MHCLSHEQLEFHFGVFILPSLRVTPGLTVSDAQCEGEWVVTGLCCGVEDSLAKGCVFVPVCRV